MQKTVFLLLSLLVLFSCSNKDADQFLSKPPYDKLSDSIQQSPANAQLYYHRGTLLYRNNELAYAEKDLRRAWQLEPTEEFALGVITVLKQKNTDSAILFLQQAIQKLPNSIALQVGLAQGYRKQNKLNEALEICNRVTAQYPGQLDALQLKAEILKSQNREDEAMLVLEEAYSYAPDDVELVHNLAFDYAEAKNPKALALSDSLIKADLAKTHAEPYYFKGVYYSNVGNAQEAIRQFDEAIRTNHNFMDAYINKGVVYYDQKKYDQALASFELALNVFPDEADPYYWIAKTQEATGKKDEAKTNYLRAFTLDQTLTQAKEAADKL